MKYLTNLVKKMYKQRMDLLHKKELHLKMTKLQIGNLSDLIYFGKQDFEVNIDKDAMLYESKIAGVDELNTFYNTIHTIQ